MSPTELAVAAELARRDPYFYARFMFKARKRLTWRRGPHHPRIFDALMRVYRGEVRNLLINMPPRYSKTESVTSWITWCYGKHPDAEFIYLSYASPLAEENSGNMRQMLLQPEYGAIFPETRLQHDSRSKQHWKTTANGVMYATGSEGTITGFGAGKEREGFGGCFPAGTQVWTEHGLEPIDAIVRARKAIKVWSYDYRGSMVLRNVSAWYENPPNAIVRVSFDDGESVECTPCHRFWTNNRGWVRADSLRENDRLPRVNRGVQSLENIGIDAQGSGSGLDPSPVLAAGSVGPIGEGDAGLQPRQLSAQVGSNAALQDYASAARDGGPRVAAPDLIDDCHRDAVFEGQIGTGNSRCVVDGERLFVGQDCDRVDLGLAESAVPLAVQDVGGASVVAQVRQSVVEVVPVAVANVGLVGTGANECEHDQPVHAERAHDTPTRQADSEVAAPVRAGAQNLPSENVRLSSFGDNSAVLASHTSEVADGVRPFISGHRKPTLVEFVRHVDSTFCLTVDEHHNFTVESGLVVKNCIVIDDPHKPDEARSQTRRASVINNFKETIKSRRNQPEKTPMIVIMQRLHMEDLSGHVMSGDDGEQWEVLNLPALQEDGTALWPEKHSLETLLAMQTASPYVFAGQYQQRPAPAEGGDFKPDKIEVVDTLPAGLFTRVRGWDLAASKDRNSAWTVGTKLARHIDTGRTYIEDVVRFRGDPHEVRQTIKATASQDGARVLQSIPQDPGQAGKVQVADFASLLNGYLVKFSPESGDKEGRAGPFASQVNAGNVLAVRGPWNAAYFEELRMFPNATKDQVDASSRAYAEMDNSMERFMALAGR